MTPNRTRTRPSGARGFSMMEILVTIVILAFGLVADAAFSWADERIRRRRGLADVAA